MMSLQPIAWCGENGNDLPGYLRLLDQTKLPNEEAYLDCRDVESVWQAIKRLSVRGAPAIGISAAYGCLLAVQHQSVNNEAQRKVLREKFTQAADYLATSRPTAVNLFWALDRMRKRLMPSDANIATLLHEARAIHREDEHMCRLIGEHGLARLQKVFTAEPALLTHCNAGALATGGIGTATAPMYVAHEQGMNLRVFADETRPLLQGARLTAFELARAGIHVTLICDDMAGQVMASGKVQAVIVGADRIAANGDTANKIGTYTLAVLARHHGVPFFVAAPSSTFDLKIPDGSHIPIEQRDGTEITHGFGKATTAQLPMLHTYNPAFDVTPAALVTAIITEKGVIEPVHRERIERVLKS